MQDYPPNIDQHFISQLLAQGYAVLPQFISVEHTQLLINHAKTLQKSALLQPASVGKSAQHNANMRGDATYWLDEHSQNAAEQFYLTTMQTLQNQLNHALFLGLHTFESHFAAYPVGAFYQKHLDQFKPDPFKTDTANTCDVRQVSSILYLNDGWQFEDGGQLRLYLDEHNVGQTLDIAPIGGTLVLFLSARFYHEVLPAKRERLSISGWYKTRANLPF